MTAKPKRLAVKSYQNGVVSFTDMENPHAWVQSDISFNLEETR
jgi:hypothetical protein